MYRAGLDRLGRHALQRADVLGESHAQRRRVRVEVCARLRDAKRAGRGRDLPEVVGGHRLPAPRRAVDDEDGRPADVAHLAHRLLEHRSVQERPRTGRPQCVELIVALRGEVLVQEGTEARQVERDSILEHHQDGAHATDRGRELLRIPAEALAQLTDRHRTSRRRRERGAAACRPPRRPTSPRRVALRSSCSRPGGVPPDMSPARACSTSIEATKKLPSLRAATAAGSASVPARRRRANSRTAATSCPNSISMIGIRSEVRRPSGTGGRDHEHAARERARQHRR